jgi:hypothetical protein
MCNSTCNIKTVLTLDSWLRNYSLFCMENEPKDADTYDAGFAYYMHDTTEYIKLAEENGELYFEPEYH